jgi:DNA-binding response OmpR family regulator
MFDSRPDQQAPATRRPGVLIVDDDEDIVLMIRFMLERQGYLCVPAYSGAQGQYRFRQEIIDVVITDLHMPLGDGMTLISAIRQVSCVPIIAISGFGGHYFDRLPSLFKIFMHQKPLNLGELLTELHGCCPVLNNTFLQGIADAASHHHYR